MVVSYEADVDDTPEDTEEWAPDNESVRDLLF